MQTPRPLYFPRAARIVLLSLPALLLCAGVGAQQRTVTLVVATDAACTLRLDGEAAGQLGAGDVKKLTVSPGEHLLSASDASGRSWQQTISISEGQRVVQVQFAGAAPAAPPSAPAPAAAPAAAAPPASPAANHVVRSGIRLRVDGDKQTGFNMAQQLNNHGKDKNLHFTLAEQDYDFRIAVYTEGMSTADVLFGGGADSSAVVLTPQCEMLFVVTRSGRMTQGGALNAVSKELVKKFDSYLRVTGQ